jgi:hypothetical protein
MRAAADAVRRPVLRVSSSVFNEDDDDVSRSLYPLLSLFDASRAERTIDNGMAASPNETYTTKVVNPKIDKAPMTKPTTASV